VAAVRASFRVARRDVWRNRARSLLIAVMVGLPVMAASTSAVLFRSDQHDPRDVVQIALGDQAQARIEYQAGLRIHQGPINMSHTGRPDSKVPKLRTESQVRAALQERIPERDRLVTDVSFFVNNGIRFGDQKMSLHVREIDYQVDGLAGLIEQRSGRAPAAANEVVITQALARRQEIEVGDVLAYTPAKQAGAQRLRVVGIVGGANVIGISSVIGRPGDLIPAATISYDEPYLDGRASTEWLVLGSDPVSWNRVIALNGIGGSVTSREAALKSAAADRIPGRAEYGTSVGAETVGITAVVIGLVLLQIALLAGPAIAVGARRNQRGLAIMSSTGAERRHLRYVLLAGNGLIGLVAGVVAAGLGAGLGAVIALVMMSKDNGQIVRVDVHWLDLFGLAAVAVLTAVAAALIPARQAARLDVVAVLTGRRGQLPSRAGVSLLGLALAAIGLVLAYQFSGRHAAFPAVAALALTEIGLIAATGAVVSLAARAAGRLPFAARFALRDAARQRGRTVPAVAAVLAAVAGATCALIVLAGQADVGRRSYTPEVALGKVLVALDEDPSVDRATVEAAVRRTLPVTSMTPYRSLAGSYRGSDIYLNTVRPPQSDCPVTARISAPSTDPYCFGDFSNRTFSGTTDIIDDGSAYPLLSGVNDPAAVNALAVGRVLVRDPLMIWPDGSVHVKVGRYQDQTDSGTNPAERTVVLPGSLISVPTDVSLPMYPLSAAQQLGVTPKIKGLVADTRRMPTKAEEAKTLAAVESAGGLTLLVERGYENDYSIGLLALVIAAMVVGLGGTFAAVGLAAAESRADIATLAAVGAGPSVRRRLAASQAGVIAGLGSVLGVFSGLVAGWVLIRMKQSPGGWGEIGVFDHWSSDWRLVLPWPHLLAIGIGIPLLAIAVGFLTTRSRLPLVRRYGQ
jgi:putative ABC transport system permease protein